MGQRKEWWCATSRAVLVTGLLLTGCAPSGDDPPTDGEIFAGLQAFWRERVPVFSHAIHEDFNEFLVPISAKAQGDGVTQETAMGKLYAVTVAYTYQARGSFTYECDAKVTTHIQVASASQSPFPNSAKAGDTITCAAPVSFTKVDQGWVMNFGMSGYLLKR